MNQQKQNKEIEKMHKSLTDEDERDKTRRKEMIRKKMEEKISDTGL